jgi:hypothetical protein
MTYLTIAALLWIGALLYSLLFSKHGILRTRKTPSTPPYFIGMRVESPSKLTFHDFHVVCDIDCPCTGCYFDNAMCGNTLCTAVRRNLGSCLTSGCIHYELKNNVTNEN